MRAIGVHFKTFQHMKSIYIFKDPITNNIIIISTYVDDVKKFFSDENLMHRVKFILDEQFILEDRTNHNFYLGNNETHNEYSTHICSETLINKMIQQHKLEDIQDQQTPTRGDRRLSTKAMKKIENLPTGKYNINYYTQFRSILGIVLYIALNTRPDIMYATIRITRNQTNPNWGDYEDLLYIVGYLKATPKLGILFNGNWLNEENEPRLSLFTDASYADIQDGKRSSIGHILYLGQDIISYYASATKNIVRSTCEAELYSLDNGVLDSYNIQRFIQELHELPNPIPTEVHCDNLAAIHVLIKNKFHKGLKHTDIAIAYLREKFHERKYKLHHVPTNENVSDIFSKALYTLKFKEIRHKLFNMSYIKSK